MKNALIFALVLLGFTVAFASEHVYRYRCGDCSKVASFTNDGTHYCTGTSESPHTKRIMERLDAERAKTFRYRCPDCGMVQEYTSDSTYYCFGSTDKPHSKTIMQRMSNDK